MSTASTDVQGRLFERMDEKAREVVEKRFAVKLDGAQSSERCQAAWDVYQNATVQILKAIAAKTQIDDPAGYAATIARNRCRDYWRAHNPGWAELKGRLSRFFRKQPAYALWSIDEQLGSICGPANWRSRPLAEAAKIAELIDNPRRIRTSALPKTEVIEKLDAPGWARLLEGFFEYLNGPIRLDEMVSIAGVLFGVKGSREMAFDELPGPAEGKAWEPAAREPHQDAVLAIREQIRRLWSELRSMPKRWVIPFLLNPPVMKGSGRKPRQRPLEGEIREAEKPDRGEIAVFTTCGVASVDEIEALIAFKEEQYALLWRKLEVEAHGGPPLASLADAHGRFAVIWDLLPLEDEVIAAAMGLDSGQKVINLRMVAKNHLAKVLSEPIPKGAG
ncbi:MAG TPA: sigma factor [Bryobacteraceae bacterium]|nr:sigma factor [Bryobacteraceae bacterium]